jgi:hypothetical protein
MTESDQGQSTTMLSGNGITALAPLGESSMWVGTQCSGLFTLRDGKVDQQFRAEESELPDNGIGALHTDPQGALWVVTRLGYLYAFDGTRWKIFGNPGFVKETAFTETEINDQKLYKSKNVVAFSPDSSVWLLHGRKGTLWQMVDGVLTGTGVDGPPGTTTNAIAFDGSDVLFAATSSGPAFFDGKMLVPIGPEALQGVAVNDLSYSKERNQLLFATDAGLWIRDDANQWRELEFTPGSTAIAAPPLGGSIRSVWNGGGRIVAIFSGSDTVALDRAEKMMQINSKASISTVGFLSVPDQGPLALLASGNGAPRIERVDELGWVEYAPLRQTREAPFKWWVNNLADLDRRNGRITTIAELVSKPKAYSGAFVTVQARSIEEYRLADAKGNTLPYRVHTAFKQFAINRQETLGLPVIGNSDADFILSGYFETGGCYEYNAPYFFYVTDYYPAAWPAPQTNVLYDELDTLCSSDATACCCEPEEIGPMGGALNPLACPRDPCL